MRNISYSQPIGPVPSWLAYPGVTYLPTYLQGRLQSSTVIRGTRANLYRLGPQASQHRRPAPATHTVADAAPHDMPLGKKGGNPTLPFNYNAVAEYEAANNVTVTRQPSWAAERGPLYNNAPRQQARDTGVCVRVCVHARAVRARMCACVCTCAHLQR